MRIILITGLGLGIAAVLVFNIAFGAQVPVRVDESDRMAVYAKILEHENIALKIQPLQVQLQSKKHELDILLGTVFEKYGMDRTTFDLDYATGVFVPRTQATTTSTEDSE